METSVALGTSVESTWQNCLNALEPRFTKATFETWIKPMRLERRTADEVTLAVHNTFAKDWAENRLKPPIMTVLGELLGSSVGVKFVVSEPPEPASQHAFAQPVAALSGGS